MLMVSAFGGLMYVITGKAHDRNVALVYLGYAAVPFVASFVFHVYRGKWVDGRQRRRALPIPGRLRLSEDAHLSE
jgi:hypothetical protein